MYISLSILPRSYFTINWQTFGERKSLSKPWTSKHTLLNNCVVYEYEIEYEWNIQGFVKGEELCLNPY